MKSGIKGRIRQPSKNDRSMSAAKCAQTYVGQRSATMDCLRRGIINYSALAREICRHYSLAGDADAVNAALRRLRRRLKSSVGRDADAAELLQRARLRIRTQITVAIVSKRGAGEGVSAIQSAVRKEGGDFNVIEGEEVVTMITNDGHARLVEAKVGRSLVKITKGLVQVTIVFGRKVESVPGVVSSIYSVLADAGVNIVEEMSCWTDLMIIVREADLVRVLSVLKFGGVQIPA